VNGYASLTALPIIQITFCSLISHNVLYCVNYHIRHFSGIAAEQGGLMRRYSRILLASLLFCAAMFPLWSESLVIYTEENAPLQTLDAGKVLRGLAVEVVQEIQRRVGNDDAIQLVPWARGYDEILKKPNVVLFSMSRTAERNPLFQWVGPVAETRYAFYSRADSKLAITSLDDARKAAYVGVVLNDVRDQFLKKAEFPNLDRSNDYATSLKKLLAGRIDLAVCSVAGIESQLEALGSSLDAVREQYVFLSGQLFIAFSKATDPRYVQRWADAFDAMQKDGSYVKIYRKYYPRLPLPGPAITQF